MWIEASCRNNFCVLFAFFACSFYQPPLLTGVTPIDATPSKPYAECYRVVLDGSVVGWVERELAPEIAETLRRFKVVLFKMFLSYTSSICGGKKNRHIWNFF